MKRTLQGRVKQGVASGLLALHIKECASDASRLKAASLEVCVSFPVFL
jgi:hypothetical protein